MPFTFTVGSLVLTLVVAFFATVFGVGMYRDEVAIARHTRRRRVCAVLGWVIVPTLAAGLLFANQDHRLAERDARAAADRARVTQQVTGKYRVEIYPNTDLTRARTEQVDLAGYVNGRLQACGLRLAEQDEPLVLCGANGEADRTR